MMFNGSVGDYVGVFMCVFESSVNNVLFFYSQETWICIRVIVEVQFILVLSNFNWSFCWRVDDFFLCDFEKCFDLRL